MKLLVLGDIGSAAGYHAGDEAMAEAFVEEMSARGEVSVTAVSGSVQDTQERYGWAAVPRLGFAALSHDRSLSEERLAAIERTAKGEAGLIPWDDPAWAVIEAVSESDAVTVTGGGNLNSSWPEHIYERAALARLAAVFGKPLVVSGQTVGPHLVRRDGELVAGLLNSAALVGVREADSRALVLQLGVPAEKNVATIDDASYLADTPPEWAVPNGAYVAATFAPYAGIVGPELHKQTIVEIVERVIALTGCDVVLLPHQGESDGAVPTEDLAFHAAVAAEVSGGRVHSAPVMTARQIAAVTRGAQLVVSSRYHPLVFGLSGNVPCVGIGVDLYTSIKITGALANFGMGSFACTPGALAAGGVVAAIETAWAGRTSIVEHLEAVNAVRRADSARWWDAVQSTLRTGSSASLPELTEVPDAAGPEWAREHPHLDEWSASLGNRLASHDLQHAETVLRLQEAEARVFELECQVASVEAELDKERDESALLRDGAAAARALVADLLENDNAVLRSAVFRMEEEITALRSTRLFRYTRLPRRVYGRILR